MIPFGFYSSRNSLPITQPIPGMSIWLKSDTQILNTDSNPCANGDRVLAWRDQSGNGNDFGHVSSPLYQSNQLNGYPAVYFDNNEMDSIYSVTPRYVFFVVNIPSNQQGDMAWNVLLGLAGGGDSGYIARLQYNDSSQWANDQNSLLGVGRANGSSIGGYTTDDNPVYNNVFAQYTSGPNSGYVDSDRTDIFALGSTNSRPIVAQLVEVLVYDFDLTENQISHNEDYLISKYGIAPAIGSSLWLKSDIGVLNGSGNPCSDGGSVVTWNDQSGNNNNATVPYNSPSFKAVSLNGLPSIQWNGTSNQGFLVTMTRTFPETQFYICYDDPSDTDDRTVSDGNVNTRRLLTHHDGGYPNWSLFYGGSQSAFNTEAPQGTWSLITVLYNGSSSVFKVNGYPINCSLDNASSSQLSIGNDGNFQTGLVGYINEVIIYPSALSNDDIFITESYLTAKYNLSFAPPDYGNLIRWWEPSTNFDGSSNWTDKIYGVTMTGTASAYSNFANKSKPAIHCSGGNGLIDPTDYTGTHMSVYYVAQPVSPPYRRILTASVNNWLLGWWNGQQGSFFFDGLGSWLYHQATDRNPHIYAMNTNGSFANCYGDGNLIVSGTDGASSPHGLCIGGGGAFGGEWTECYVGDILIFNTVHDTTTAKQVMAWLNTKYGVY